jgi:D-tyrosyl-tRNA(Tyr) deacylase
MRLVIQRVRRAVVRVKAGEASPAAQVSTGEASPAAQRSTGEASPAARMSTGEASPAARPSDGDPSPAASEVAGEIGRGLLVLVGVERGDGPEAARAAAEKLAGLRVFDDEAGRMNLDAAAVGGSFLVVSQFTLAGSVARGRRPSFDRAAPPAEAAPLVDALVAELRRRGATVAEGRFRAHMEVELVNDGPVTLVADF